MRLARSGSLLSRLKRKGVRNLVRIGLGLAWHRAFSLGYAAWLRALGVRVGRGIRFHGRIEVIGDPRRVTLGDRCSIHRGARFWTHDYGAGHGEIVLGREVTVLRNVSFNSWERIVVGDQTAFGDGCYVQDNDHGTEAGVPIMRQPTHGAPILIGRDVWFGARCIVLKGVEVGDATVVGAGSVVVKSLPPGVVAVGSPCRPVKARGGAAEPARHDPLALFG
jgi:acetyltransferase-like isoleucine patch superfamily enzyme